MGPSESEPQRAHGGSTTAPGQKLELIEFHWKVNLAIGKAVKRKFRLRKSTDFKRVRRMGKTYAHPLIVLIAHFDDSENSRFAVAAGRSLGKAVQRNRAKRIIREALRSLIPAIKPGWDIILLARRPMNEATLQQSQAALTELLHRARLLNKNDGD